MEEAALRILRAKYLDWCSARIAEQLVDLSPEEMYSLARPAPDADTPPDPLPPSTDSDSYRVLVQRVTESLLSRSPLPPFEAWRVDYEASPDRYDAELLGFWKDL